MDPRGGSTDWALFRSLVAMTDVAGESAPASRGALLATCCRYLEADLLYIVLPSDEGWIKTGIGPDGERGRLVLSRPTGIVRHVLSKRSRILQERLTSRSSFHRYQDGWPGHATSSYLAVPIHRHGHVLGVLVLLRGADRPPFALPDLTHAELLAEVLAIRSRLDERVAELERLARTDEVTGLPNDRLGREILAREIRRARQGTESLAIMIVAVDGLRTIRESEGYAVANEILRDVARAIARSVRGADHVARFCGDEFLVVLPETGREGSACAAARIRDTVAHELSRRADAGAIGCACAAACLPDDGTDGVRLLGVVARFLALARRKSRRAEGEEPLPDRQVA